jgi:hypothetical protein
VKRRTNATGEKGLRYIQGQRFFRDILQGICDKGYASEVIISIIQSPEIEDSIEKMGVEGYLDFYLPKPWDQIAGMDIKYRGSMHGLNHHEFRLEIDGELHEEFLFAFPTLDDALKN